MWGSSVQSSNWLVSIWRIGRVLLPLGLYCQQLVSEVRFHDFKNKIKIDATQYYDQNVHTNKVALWAHMSRSGLTTLTTQSQVIEAIYGMLTSRNYAQGPSAILQGKKWTPLCPSNDLLHFSLKKFDYGIVDKWHVSMSAHGLTICTLPTHYF